MANLWERIEAKIAGEALFVDEAAKEKLKAIVAEAEGGLHGEVQRLHERFDAFEAAIKSKVEEAVAAVKSHI